LASLAELETFRDFSEGALARFCLVDERFEAYGHFEQRFGLRRSASGHP
jgi:hypothetical protein